MTSSVPDPDLPEARHASGPTGGPSLLNFMSSLRQDLTDARWIYLKAVLFLVLGCLASGLILAENGTWKTAGLLLLTIWCFCRAYYFAFYVIEHYVDSRYRFDGLLSFGRYLLGGGASEAEHQRDKNEAAAPDVTSSQSE